MSKDVTVSAKVPANKDTGAPEIVGSANIKWGETPEETIKMYGADEVVSNALANATVTVQSGIRRMLKAGKTAEEIQATYSAWVLGKAIARVVDPTAAIMAAWPTMSEEKRAAFLKELKAK